MENRLPLYEGVDWNQWYISRIKLVKCLPLYEGVDWNICHRSILYNCDTSPSLRGSGLKCSVAIRQRILKESPSLRGSGLKSVSQERIRNPCKSPSLRGSGLKLAVCSLESELSGSPSLRGSGLKFVRKRLLLFQMVVSLFTREWIEIGARLGRAEVQERLPLYEGVDWNLSP